MKCWMVFGERYGNISYGMSHCICLFAVCSTKEEAEECLKHYSNSNSPVLTADRTMIFNDDIFEEMTPEEYLGYETFNAEEILNEKDLKDKALKYKDFRIYIAEFSGAPLRIVNDWYVE